MVGYGVIEAVTGGTCVEMIKMGEMDRYREIICESVFHSVKCTEFIFTTETDSVFSKVKGKYGNLHMVNIVHDIALLWLRD